MFFGIYKYHDLASSNEDLGKTLFMSAEGQLVADKNNSEVVGQSLAAGKEIFL